MWSLNVISLQLPYEKAEVKVPYLSAEARHPFRLFFLTVGTLVRRSVGQSVGFLNRADAGWLFGGVFAAVACWTAMPNGRCLNLAWPGLCGWHGVDGADGGVNGGGNHAATPWTCRAHNEQCLRRSLRHNRVIDLQH